MRGFPLLLARVGGTVSAWSQSLAAHLRLALPRQRQPSPPTLFMAPSTAKGWTPAHRLPDTCTSHRSAARAEHRRRATAPEDGSGAPSAGAAGLTQPEPALSDLSRRLWSGSHLRAFRGSSHWTEWETSRETEAFLLRPEQGRPSHSAAGRQSGLLLCPWPGNSLSTWPAGPLPHSLEGSYRCGCSGSTFIHSPDFDTHPACGPPSWNH